MAYYYSTECSHESGTATIGTQVWKYRMRDMFDDSPAANYEHGKTADMEKRFNQIREAYQRAGFRVEVEKPRQSKVSVNGRSWIQVSQTIFVYDVPLKCLKGKRAKTLLIHLWINL